MSFAPSPALLDALLDAERHAARHVPPARGAEPRVVGPGWEREVRRPAAVEVRAGAGRVAPADRASGVAWLAGSHERLRTAFGRVPPGRWAARPAPGRWSAAEVCEHLVRTEHAVRTFVRGPLLDAVGAAHVGRVGPDARVRARLADRSRPMRTPEALAPAGGVGAGWRAGARAPLLDALLDARARTLAVALDPALPLRAHAAPHPELGVLDGWQWLLFLAAHADRHAAALAERAAR